MFMYKVIKFERKKTMKRTKTILTVFLAATLIFSSAIAIFAKPETTAYASGSFNSANAYVAKEVTILTRAVTDTKTYSTIGTASARFVLAKTGDLKDTDGKDYNYFGLIFCEPAANGYYKVTKTEWTLGRDGKTFLDERAALEIPKDGFIIGINGEKTDVFADLQAKTVVGDFVKLIGTKVADLEIEEATVAALTGASYQLFHDDGTVEESSKPAESSKPDTVPETGDITVVFAIIAIVSVAGAVVVKKVRR